MGNQTTWGQQVNEIETKKTMKIPVIWHYKMLGSFFVVLFIFICVSVVIISKENLFIKQIDIVKEFVYEHTVKLGLTLDDVLIEGRDKISRQEIIDKLNLDRNSSFLKIKEDDIEALLSQLPWVSSVKVKKNYLPNVLQISLKEKKVLAIWQDEKNFYALDEKAQVIKTDFKPNKDFILVVGKKAPENLLDLLQIISKNSEVWQRIKVVQFISERRWNVVFDDINSGMVIKLPEANIDLAWKKMLKLNTTHGILKRPLTIIDLRFKDKVIVKLNKAQPRERVKENKA